MAQVILTRHLPVGRRGELVGDGWVDAGVVGRGHSGRRKYGRSSDQNRKKFAEDDVLNFSDDDATSQVVDLK